MKYTLFILLITVSLSGYSQPGTKNFLDRPYIEVVGKAEMEITADEIYLKILIDENEVPGNKTVEELEDSMIKKLTEIGIDVSKELKVKDILSNFRDYWLRRSEIQTVKEYQLTVHDAKTAGKVIRELESLGISSISLVRIGHSEIQKFKIDVKVMAVKAAEEKAKALTGAIGQNIGKALFIQELEQPVYRTMDELSNIRVSKTTVENEPDIEFEKITLESSVIVRFELLE